MKWWSRLKSWCTGTYFARHAEQWTKRKGTVTAFGKTSGITMPINEDGTVDYTLEEIGKMTILCGWCKQPIFIGEPITLYSTHDSDFVIPEHAVVYSRDPLTVVGCLGWDCADTGADRAGFWQPNPNRLGEGYVYRVLSPLEQIVLNAENGNDLPIIVGDVRNIREAAETTRHALENQ